MTFSKTSGLSDRELNLICEVFRKFADIKQAVIFGSRALGNFKTGSDIDIALKGTIRPQTIALTKSALEEESPLPYFFDVISYEQIENPALKQHIDVHGRVFYDSGKSPCLTQSI